MLIRWAAVAERLRGSLFFVPMLCVIAGVVLGELMVRVDRSLDTQGTELPLGLASTVQSARAVLGTIAGATITVAGIAFSVSLLIIQLASSQYSPRVVHSLFRDPFNRRVMGVVVGTFSYCIVVLMTVRGPIDPSGEPVVPSLSVVVAATLGIIAVLTIVAFIDHSAHSMDVSEILHDVTDDSIQQARKVWPEPADDDRQRPPAPVPESDGHVIRFGTQGWVQQIDERLLLRVAGPGGTVRFESAVGWFALAGAPLCTVWPVPDDPEEVEEAEQRARAAVGLGQTRTMQQDPAYGLRQLVDVALKALSPGINDPTTAQDAMFHAGAVLAELFRREPPGFETFGEEGRRAVFPHRNTHADLVELTFAEVRRAAAGAPAVCVYLLETIRLLCASLPSLDDERAVLLRAQARLVVEGCEKAGALPEDLENVRRSYENRFGPLPVRTARA